MDVLRVARDGEMRRPDCTNSENRQLVNAMWQRREEISSLDKKTKKWAVEKRSQG
jgi:hypothetical protein